MSLSEIFCNDEIFHVVMERFPSFYQSVTADKTETSYSIITHDWIESQSEGCARGRYRCLIEASVHRIDSSVNNSRKRKLALQLESPGRIGILWNHHQQLYLRETMVTANRVVQEDRSLHRMECVEKVAVITSEHKYFFRWVSQFQIGSYWKRHASLKVVRIYLRDESV